MAHDRDLPTNFPHPSVVDACSHRSAPGALQNWNLSFYQTVIILREQGLHRRDARDAVPPSCTHGPRLSGTMVLYVYSIFKLTKVVYKNGITTFIPLLIVFCCCFDCSLRPIPGDGEHCTAPGTAEPPQEPSILRHDVSHLTAPHTRSPAVRVRALAAARGRALLSRVVVDGKTANHHRSARAAGTAFGLRPPRNHGTRPRMLVREPRPHEE